MGKVGLVDYVDFLVVVGWFLGVGEDCFVIGG